MRLVSKSAVVTGSSRGVGAEIAHSFAREGARIIVNCHQDVGGGEAVVRNIVALGGEAKLCVADVRIPADAERLVRCATDTYGRLDVLVNNAGISRDVMIDKMTEDDWQCVLSTNLTGSFNCARAAFRQMKRQGGGRIINISSVVAEMGNIGQANYVASKSGVIGLTRAFALEGAKHGILVNAIAPGFCTTRMTESIPDRIKERIIDRIPLRRFATPSEIASVAVFLSSDECSYMAGEIVSVNGGLHL
jgi:3-oxoacyl-[acyl-carrier protein] reductase